ncbi:MAG TPA: HAD-IB family phosphatase [Patescibacteria group bacterium]|nr:HAD-IB family phosphatase [Patescibacteria group bacterium]
MIKAVLLDLDGTLVDADMSVVIAKIVDKHQEVSQNNHNFHQGITKGLEGLIASINLFKGISLSQIEERLSGNDCLMPGARALVNFLHENGIISILASGSILPILQHYQQELKLDYVIGSRPRIQDNIIMGISEDDYPHPDFKLYESRKILEGLGIEPHETVAIGDSPGDKSKFLFAGKSIAVNPKGGIEKFADFVIVDDLSRAIPIIEELNK